MRTNDTCIPIRTNAVAPQIAEALPPDLLDCVPEVALATVAAAFSCPASGEDAPGWGQLTSVNALAVRLLALYGAGAAVRFAKADFRDLDGRAAAFIAGCTDVGLKEMVAFVRRQACDRAQREGVIGLRPQRTEGLVLLELLDGRTFGSSGDQLPLAFHAAGGTAEAGARHSRLRLLTYAGLHSAVLPSLCSRASEAMVLLALYASGARIELDVKTFRALEKQVRNYRGQVTALSVTRTQERPGKHIEPIASLRHDLDAVAARYTAALPAVMAQLATMYEPATEAELLEAACAVGTTRREPLPANTVMSGYCLHRAQRRARQVGLIGSSGE